MSDSEDLIISEEKYEITIFFILLLLFVIFMFASLLYGISCFFDPYILSSSWHEIFFIVSGVMFIIASLSDIPQLIEFFINGDLLNRHTFTKLILIFITGVSAFACLSPSFFNSLFETSLLIPLGVILLLSPFWVIYISGNKDVGNPQESSSYAQSNTHEQSSSTKDVVQPADNTNHHVSQNTSLPIPQKNSLPKISRNNPLTSRTPPLISPQERRPEHFLQKTPGKKL